VLAVALPFLLWDARALVYNIAVLPFTKSVPLPRGLSWQWVLLPVLPPAFYAHLGPLFYTLFVVAVFLWRNRPPITLCAFTFSAFLLTDHKIWEQYLTWPLPFLIALALLRRDLAPAVLAAGMTLAALFMNEQGNPVDQRFYLRLVPYPPVMVNVLLAAGIVLYIVLTLRSRRPLDDCAEGRALQQ
jgi:hypothetical protein